MEIAGIESINPCSTCICATCTRGFIHPSPRHDCPVGSTNCDKCKRNLSSGGSEEPLRNCAYWSDK